MTKQTKSIPIDSKHVDEGGPTPDEYQNATAVGRDLRTKILAQPKGRAGYEQAQAEISRHQSSLAEVRKIRSLAQATLAEIMNMDQSEISRLERRSDLLLSTIRRFIQATGGDLRLVASYPEGDIDLAIGEALRDEELASVALLDER